MAAVFSGIYHFLEALFNLLGGFFHMAFWLGLALIVLVVLQQLALRLRQRINWHSSNHGFFHVHDRSDFKRKPAIESRKSCGGHEEGHECCPEPECESSVPNAEGKPYAVLRFDNDIMASYNRPFARLVDEVLANQDRWAGVVVAANSPGGSVAEYGLMYAEMERLRAMCDSKQIELIGLTDTYAASGGMLELLPCHKIVAAPFAIVGSIGVVSEFLNFNKLLTSIGIEPVTNTAGDLKRTTTPFGPITEEATKHDKAKLEAIHAQFIQGLIKYRKFDADRVKAVCTGEHWTAQEAYDRKLGIVDAISTTQGYLFNLNQKNDLVILSELKNPWERGLFRFLAGLLDHVMLRARMILMGRP